MRVSVSRPFAALLLTSVFKDEMRDKMRDEMS